MALKVTTAPTYTGKLKVTTNYQPKVNLKVTTKPVNYVTPRTYNPQKSVSPQPKTWNPQPKTYNPQQAASAKQLQQAQVAKDWAQKEATRLRAEADRIATEKKAELKRLADAKNIEIEGRKQGWLGKLTLQSDFKARNARETANQYLQYNNDTVAPNLMGRKRDFENEQAKRYQKYVDSLQSATNQAEADKAWGEFDDWYKRTANQFQKDVTEFITEQEQLASYAGQPISSFAGNALGSVKRLGSKVGGFGWNALSWTTSQPRRAVNTGMNFFNPNRQRMYEDGTEIKKGSDITNVKGSNPLSQGFNQLQNAYNQSKNQRVFGYSKDHEAEMLKDIESGELEFGANFGSKEYDKFRAKYGDDVWDALLDPINFLPNGWFGKGVKAGKGSQAFKQVASAGSKLSDEFYKLASKSPKITNFLISRAAKKSNPHSIGKWLNKPVGKSADDFVHDNKALIKFRNNASTELGKRSDEWRNLQRGVTGNTQAKLSKLSDDEARILQEFMLPQTFANQARGATKKLVFDWTDVELPRGFNKSARNKIEDLARSLKNQSDTLTKMGIDYDEIYNAGLDAKRFKKGASAYVKGKGLQYSYVPNYHPKPSQFGKIEKSKRASKFYLQKKTGEFKQSAEELKKSFGKRATAQLYNDTSEGRWLANNADDYKKALADMSKTLNWRKKGYGNSVFNSFNEKSLTNKYSPVKLWTKAVLPLNPSWYVNNLGVNVPSSISASGPDTLWELARLATKKGRNFDDLPDELIEMLGSMRDYAGGGKLGKFASAATDDPFRIAVFRSLKKQGFDDKSALKELLDWFPDYKLKNWERPIKAVSPFYKWQEHLIKLSVKMPFKRPRSAKFYSTVHDELFTKPHNRLPDYPQTYTDEQGQEQSFNPKEAFKGQMFVGNDENGNPKFASTPFWALNPDTMTEFGLNPALTTAMDFYSSTNKWGQKNTDKNLLQLGAERFPQYNLYNAWREQNQKPVERWFTESGNSKYKQGHDKSLPNYDKSLDKNRTFDRRRNSFFGGQIFNQNTFEKDEFDKKFRLSGFNKDFFAVDWDKRLEELQAKAGDKYYEFNDPKNPYNVQRAEQEALAKKYGFDYQKDIIDDYWTKNDTATTTNTKRLKQDARRFTGDFWEDYLSQPAGNRTTASKRRPYLIKKYREWADNDTFAENGYRRLPKFSVYDAKGNDTGEKEVRTPYALEAEEAGAKARRAIGKAKYQRYLEYQKAKKSGDWSWFGNSRGTSDKAKAYKEAKASGDWTAYRSKYGSKFATSTGKESPYQFEGKYFKSQESMDKFVAGKFWRDYYALDSVEEKQALLDKFPQFRSFEQPKTQEEWDKVKDLLKKQRNEKLGKMTGFTDSRMKIKEQIERSTPSGFGGKRRLRYKF